MRLSVDGPSDRATTLDGSVSVTGTVAPAGATVLVAGQAARVQAGMFWASVPIRPGTNVIDVLAGAPDASPAVAAVRVYRELPVSVPRLGGDSPAAAVAALGKLGLQAKVVDVGGFLQSLIPTSTQVCQTSPSAGADLAPGGQVQVQVAKLC